MTDPRHPSTPAVPSTDSDPTMMIGRGEFGTDSEQTTVLPAGAYAAPAQPTTAQPAVTPPGAEPTVNLGELPEWALADAQAEQESAVASEETDVVAPPRKRAAWKIPAIVAGAVLVLVGGAYAFDLIRTSGQIEAGTTIGQVDVGGLTPQEAQARLQEQTEPLRQPLSLTSHENAVSLDPHTAGLSFDIAASVEAAGTRSANPIDRLTALFGTENSLPLIATVDEPALVAQLSSVAEETDIQPVEGALTLAGTELTVVEPVTGRSLDVSGATELVRTAWLSGNPSSAAGLTLPSTEVPVRASAEKTSAAKTEIETVLAGPLKVTAGDTAFEIPVETLAAALTVAPDAADGFTVTVDEAAISAGMAGQLAAVETAPVDASLALKDGAPVITPAVNGMALDSAATATALTAALRDPGHTLQVAYQVSEPELTTAEVEGWGITAPVADFKTSGFAWDSGQNVKMAAAEVNGAIVQPGETFSLNGHTGPRTAAEGYIPAGIIQDGVPSRAVGGGISQFATTLFNASYFAGMEDIEHKAHSYYISRYPEGREATVFQTPEGDSVIDVKFKNNFDTAVLIETIWTDNDITVRFWGTPTVQIESITGERYNYTGAPTKTIPYGQPCNATGGSGGFSVDNTRVVKDLAGNEISRNSMSTAYRGQVKVICEPAPVAPVDPAAGGAVTDPPALPEG